MKKLLMLALAAAAACRTVPAPAGDDPAATWRASGVRDYSVRATVACFCVHRGEYVVTVRDGQVTAARPAAGVGPVPEATLSLLPSVDGLFEQLAAAQREGRPTRARFHPQLGYPVEVTIGTPENDAGVVYQLAELMPAPR